MIVTIHDEGSVNGSIAWSSPRTDENEQIDLDDWTDCERALLVDAIVDQVRAWAGRPAHKSTYVFWVRETWLDVTALRVTFGPCDYLNPGFGYQIKIERTNGSMVLCISQHPLTGANLDYAGCVEVAAMYAAPKPQPSAAADPLAVFNTGPCAHDIPGTCDFC